MAVVREMQPRVATTDEALRYYNEGIDELGKLIHGEERAKQAILIGSVLLRPVLLSGLPGGGKSSLMHNAWRLFDGIDYEDVARIPSQHDLAATQLVGGKISTTKETGGKTETSTVTVSGLVKPTTKGLIIEEMNRINPEAVNSLLPVLEDRRLETTAGHISVPGLMYTVAAMNPSESKQSTFPISDAAASRLTLGAVMGVRGTREERLKMGDAIRAHHRQPNNKPENMQTVTNPAQLAAIRRYILRTQLSPDMSGKLNETAVDTADALADYGIHETDNRLFLHLEASAKALGSLRTEKHIVREDDVKDAVYMVMAARLGAKKQTNGLDLTALAGDIAKI